MMTLEADELAFKVFNLALAWYHDQKNLIAYRGGGYDWLSDDEERLYRACEAYMLGVDRLRKKTRTSGYEVCITHMSMDEGGDK